MKNKKAFSLVELSIVLVILGLLVGGVLSGQSLIRAAGLRATISQMTDFQVAVNGFRDKYFGLPGDITNATAFWGGAPVLNGNGDGIIGTLSCTSGNPDCGEFNGERAQVFFQLSKAGLMNGFDTSFTLGQGYPAVKLNSGTGMIVIGSWAPATASDSNMDIQTYATDPVYLFLGVCNPSQLGSGNSGYFGGCGVFSPQDSWNMDKKIDDGMPLTGKVMSTASGGNACGIGWGPTMGYDVRFITSTCNTMISIR